MNINFTCIVGENNNCTIDNCIETDDDMILPLKSLEFPTHEKIIKNKQLGLVTFIGSTPIFANDQPWFSPSEGNPTLLTSLDFNYPCAYNDCVIKVDQNNLEFNILNNSPFYADYEIKSEVDNGEEWIRTIQKLN